MVGLDTNAMLGNRLPSEPLEALGASSFTIDPFIVVTWTETSIFELSHQCNFSRASSDQTKGHTRGH